MWCVVCYFPDNDTAWTDILNSTVMFM